MLFSSFTFQIDLNPAVPNVSDERQDVTNKSRAICASSEGSTIFVKWSPSTDPVQRCTCRESSDPGHSNVCSPARVNAAPVKAATTFEQHIIKEIKQLRARVAELEQTVPQSMTGSTSKDRVSIARSEGSRESYAGVLETGEDGDPSRDGSLVGQDDGEHDRGLSGARAGPTSAPADAGKVDDAGEHLAHA